MEASEASKNALENVLEARNGEKIKIICDKEKVPVGEAFEAGSLFLGLETQFIILERSKTPRTEIPQKLKKTLNQKPDIYINILQGNREETAFRIKLITLETREREARLGHCPGITLDMLTEGALALTPQEHRTIQVHAEKLLHALKATESVEIQNPRGTNLTLSTKNRRFFTDTKLDRSSMKWMNLPTGEVIVAPVECSVNGRIVCDMAIGGIGKVRKPVEVTVKDGRAEDVTSQDADHLRRVIEIFATDSWSNIVGEFACGINPKARFVNEFLEAEKIMGTIHVAFGANTDMPGGINPSKNHVDMLISNPTVTVTNKNMETFPILKKGCFQI